MTILAKRESDENDGCVELHRMLVGKKVRGVSQPTDDAVYIQFEDFTGLILSIQGGRLSLEVEET